MKTLHTTGCLIFMAALGQACQPDATGPDSSGVADLELLTTASVPSVEATPLPFWARTLCCLDGWGVVYFYVAAPSAIPTDFNFLAFFDPRALGAEFAVEGAAQFQQPGVPRKTHLKGLGAVPVWFLPEQRLVDMAADGVITLAEIEQAEPVKGSASFFNEILSPGGGGAPNIRLNTVARGTLADGGTFRLNWNGLVNGQTGVLNLAGSIAVVPD